MLLVAVAVVPALGASGGRALAAGSSSPAVSRASAYLEHAQNPDGGFGGAPGQSTGELYTAWAAIGLAAAGHQPRLVVRDGQSVLDGVRAQAGSVQGAGDLERTILALRACGASVHSLPGGDPTVRLLADQVSDGSFEHLTNLTEFGILALRAAGLPASSRQVRAAARWLGAQQEPDGGFGFAARPAAGAGESDVDDTGAAIQALVAAGIHGRPVARAKVYLEGAQDLDGGFPQQPGEGSNAQSTAWAIQGLDAAATNVGRVRRGGSVSPLQYLEGLMDASGSVRYSRTSSQTPVWVTAQALAALAGKPLPVAPPPAAPTPAGRHAPAHANGAAASRTSPVRAHTHGLAHAGDEAARANATARALGALAALMLSPVAGRQGGEGRAAR